LPDDASQSFEFVLFHYNGDLVHEWLRGLTDEFVGFFEVFFSRFHPCSRTVEVIRDELPFKS